MYKLILMRHGQSIWNKENRFTGWVDIDLTKQGKLEAKQAGIFLKKLGYNFNIAYTSVLKRAIRTLWYVQDAMDLMYVPVVHSWKLNERHYGSLSGLNKDEMKLKYGNEKVFMWRRSYNSLPPKISDKKKIFMFHANPRYSKIPCEEIPLTESLKDTFDRVLLIWNQSIVHSIRLYTNVIIIAHGNSIRALIKYLDNISDSDIVNINIKNATPLIYDLDKDLKKIRSYLPFSL